MILGIGADIIDFKRFKSATKKAPTLIQRVFTEKERSAACKLSEKRKLAYYVKRYAGKEALSKACGTGIGKDIGWQDLEILNDKKGKPVVKLSEKALKFLHKKFKTKKITPFISLSDEQEIALAFTILTN